MKTKVDHAAPARDLYTSPLFARRRRYAEAARRPWFVLSSRWGLVAPDEVIASYDLYLGDQSRAFRTAWGTFVVEQLAAAVGPLEGVTVEVHAGEHYRTALEAPLQAHRAVTTNPVPSGGLGETIAWYDQHAPGTDLDDVDEHDPVGAGPVASRGHRAADVDPDLVQQIVGVLTDPGQRLRPAELLATAPARLAAPGLYSWWVDTTGAADLSAGADLPIAPGLIYAGLAGATRWPTGKRSTNTLWSRLAGMHLGGRAEFSTFRRTLAALLRAPLGLTSEDDPRLSEWISEHLQVTPVVVHDADTLGRLEDAVLHELDPPLNLQGMPSTPLRGRIRDLRRARLR